MRRGSHGKAIHTLEDGTLLGVNLGADFCAEHEWGIQALRQTYGINDADEGVGRRQITRFPAEQVLFDSITIKGPKRHQCAWHALVSLRHPCDRKYNELDADLISRFELHPYGEDDIYGAWDQGSFGLLVKDHAVAKELFSAFQSLDICVGLFNGEAKNPFSRSGLGILIASRIPQSVRDQWLESDRDGRRLQDAAAETGIAKRLETAGLRYFALSPKWATEMRGDKPTTKHPVVYWLNPYEQDKNNHGWFTVEDLDAWISGRGPVPKNEARVRA